MRQSDARRVATADFLAGNGDDDDNDVYILAPCAAAAAAIYCIKKHAAREYRYCVRSEDEKREAGRKGGKIGSVGTGQRHDLP